MKSDSTQGKEMTAVAAAENAWQGRMNRASKKKLDELDKSAAEAAEAAGLSKEEVEGRMWANLRVKEAAGAAEATTLVERGKKKTWHKPGWAGGKGRFGRYGGGRKRRTKKRRTKKRRTKKGTKKRRTKKRRTRRNK